MSEFSDLPFLGVAVSTDHEITAQQFQPNYVHSNMAIYFSHNNFVSIGLLEKEIEEPVCPKRGQLLPLRFGVSFFVRVLSAGQHTPKYKFCSDYTSLVQICIVILFGIPWVAATGGRTMQAGHQCAGSVHTATYFPSPPFPDSYFGGAFVMLNALLAHGITEIYGLPGGAIAELTTAMARQKKINFILGRHEQGAGFMAYGAAKATKKAAVVTSTQGSYNSETLPNDPKHC